MSNNMIESHIDKVLQKNGIILLNENKFLPSIIGEGGTWETAMSLIDKKRVFYSRIYKNRVTYISREVYYCLKDYRQNSLVSDDELMVIKLLESSNSLTTKLIKSVLPISNERIKKAMDSLSKKLLITVIRPGKKINDTWSEVEWSTYKQWEDEALLDYDYNETEKKEVVIRKLGSCLSNKEIERLIR